jgi:hypothetical protein
MNRVLLIGALCLVAANVLLAVGMLSFRRRRNKAVRHRNVRVFGPSGDPANERLEFFLRRRP